MDQYKVIKYPIVTEKSMEKSLAENKLCFAVDMKANKNLIREAVEKMYEVKVIKVNTQITTKGEKRAYTKLSPEHSAEEIASGMGVL